MNISNRIFSRYKPLKLASFLCFVVVGLVFAQLLFEIITQGIGSISIDWIFENPEMGGRAGGIASILLSTLMITAICLFIATPIALLSAAFLCECVKRRSIGIAVIYGALDLLASIPSIVFGLFGYSFFVIYLGMGFSILAGGLTLSLMILPLLIRLFKDGFTNIPDAYRLNALASGLSLFNTYAKVIIPIAKKSLITAIILSIGRSLSETAALIYTAGYVYRMPESIMDSGRTISVHILDLAMNVPGGNQNSYGSALTLLLMLFLINLLVLSSTKSQFNETGIIP